MVVFLYRMCSVRTGCFLCYDSVNLDEEEEGEEEEKAVYFEAEIKVDVTG